MHGGVLCFMLMVTDPDGVSVQTGDAAKLFPVVSGGYKKEG